MSKAIESRFESVWDALEADAGDAENLRLRAELMRSIDGRVRTQGWTQSVAATHCGLSQPRMNDLLRGRISRFSLDSLVNIASALGLQVSLKIKAA